MKAGDAIGEILRRQSIGIIIGWDELNGKIEDLHKHIANLVSA